MIKRMTTFFIICALLLSVGCAKKDDEKADNSNKAEVITEIEDVDYEEAADDNEDKDEKVDSQTDSNDVEDSANYNDGTLYSELDILNQDITEVADLFYSEESGDMQREIFALVEDYKADINFNAISGKNKEVLLNLLSESSRVQLEPVFEKGYGIVIVDSMYYPVIDYVDLHDKYIGFVSDGIGDYLEIKSRELRNPIIVEEYLSVSATELAERAMTYEKFLASNVDFKYANEINNSLMIMIWKLISPSKTDGTIDSDDKVKIDLMQSYGNIANSVDTPVLTETVKPIIKFINENNGTLNEEVLNELSDLSYKLHEQAANRIEELYGVK
jgi:hypothetical protein